MKKISITTYEPCFSNLPKAFDGFKIVQISDFHNADFEGRLEQEIKKISPDIIVITGDFVHQEYSYANAFTFAKNAVRIAPVYYVNGNHECRFKSYRSLITELQSIGVIVLENDVIFLLRGENRIAIIGMNDMRLFTSNGHNKRQVFKNHLGKICNDLASEFKILLYHRPNLFDFCADCGIDLTIAGHVHGGQIRLPLIGAVFAPGLGLFPRYADGMHYKNGKCLIISRGLWHTPRMLTRILNIPELVFVQLKRK